MVSAQLRGALSAGLSHADLELSPARKSKRNEPWPELPPLQAPDDGVLLGVVLHQGLRTALHRSLADGFRAPVLTVLASGKPVPVCWYRQQDAAWVAYYDALHRLELARYQPDDLDHLGHWAALARSCGWWWPGENRCVRSRLTANRPGFRIKAPEGVVACQSPITHGRPGSSVYSALPVRSALAVYSIRSTS